MEREGGGGAMELRRWMAATRASLEQRMADAGERTKADAAAASAAFVSARSVASHGISLREKLKELNDQQRELQADLAEVISIKETKQAKSECIRESISNATSTNDQLRTLLVDLRSKRDKYSGVISNQLEDIEALEANSDATGKKNLEEAISWYKKFLGFEVVGGDGVKFVFNKIDMQNPDREYSFCVKIIKDRYVLLQCTPFLKDSEELMKDLNCTNDLFRFVRTMRERFQAATIKGLLPASSFCLDTPSITDSSPPVLSVDTRSKSTSKRAKRGDLPAGVLPASVRQDTLSITDSPSPALSVNTSSESISNRSLRSQTKNLNNPTKRGARTGDKPSSTRCSPRFMERH